MVYVHLSDMHLTSPGKGMLGMENSFSQLELVLRDIKNRRIHPDIILISGDICFRTDSDCYAEARKVIEKYSMELGAHVVTVLGNHDNAASFREGYLKQKDSHEPFYGETIIDGLRILALDSRKATEEKPYNSTGIISDEQLVWLSEKLKTEAPMGTLLLMHHPPVMLPSDNRNTLENAEKLISIVREKKLLGVLCGHEHEADAFILDALFNCPVYGIRQDHR